MDFWELCRELNKYVGVLVGIFVCYRLTPLVLDRARWRDRMARHRTLWFFWIASSLFISSMFATYNDAVSAQAGPVSGLKVLLNLGAIALCAWWPPHTRLEDEDGR